MRDRNFPYLVQGSCHPSPYFVQDCCNPNLVIVQVIVGSNVEDLFLSVLASLVVSGCVLSRGGLFVPGAALHFPVSSLPTCSALGVFCWAGGAPWGMMLGAVSTGVLLLLFLSLSLSLSFPLAFLWGSLAYGVDIFGAA